MDIFTNNPAALEHHPIKKALNFFPKELKYFENSYTESLPNGLNIPRSTLKGCPAVPNLYNQGYIIPLWSDLILQIKGNEWKYAFADGHSSIISHDNRQLPSCLNKYIHLKLISPWLISEKRGISWVWNKCMWNNFFMKYTHANLNILPGETEYKTNHSTNINILQLAEDAYFDLKANEPLVHLIPITDKKTKISLHCIDKKEYAKIALKNNPTRWINNYRNNKKNS